MPHHPPPAGTLATLALLAALATAAEPALAQRVDPRPAEPATVAANRQLQQSLPFADQTDFADARRGFVGTLPNAEVRSADGRIAYSLAGHAFVDADPLAPDSVNPSLWRQAQLNQIHGLFKVTERMYQVRSLDISNMTIIEGDSGLILIDPLLTAETAKAALELYFQHRPRQPVRAVIYSHSHADHFGGVRGVIDEADVKAGRVAVLAPRGFMEHAVSENVIAGAAMSRRAHYQFGVFVPPGERGQVDTGLGRMLSRGNVTLIAPTDVVEKAIDTRTIDGIRIEIQLTPGTEAPSEMNLYFPQLKVLNAAENVTHTLHNLYTLRGAEIRDGLGWAKYIEQMRRLYAPRSEILVAQHHWPTFGAARIDNLLRKQRDLYQYIHDQTVRLMNQGLKPREIAERLKLPDSLANEWFARGYYGTVSHNAKAVYQKYLGWYDANPANLNPLPQAESAQRTVRYMGGAAAVLSRAREDFGRGDYRWVAEVMMQVVWAEPNNTAARQLAADALEQLGYQAESGVWRNAYLSGAGELRQGLPKATGTSTTSPDVVRAIPLDLFFDYLGVRLNPEKAAGRTLTVNWTFSDLNQKVLLRLENSVLGHVMGEHAPQADAHITLAKATLDEISLQRKTFAQAVAAGEATIVGNAQALGQLMAMLDTFPGMFEIVTPLGSEPR
ncbi:MAG: MBL fold metallo-hydrolase [Burkholderiaceae bacterium]|nr:MBL fold metallo-hydrolase [Burkholderiaceae bacterium]